MNSSPGFRNRSKTSSLTHRRGFLKSAGLLAVSFGVFGATAIEEAEAQSSVPAASTRSLPRSRFPPDRFVDCGSREQRRYVLCR